MNELPKRMPIPVTTADTVFGGCVQDILPPEAEIPEEFKNRHNPWVKWQKKWFYEGLTNADALQAKPGIDRQMALANLKCVQGSFEPKHQHKEAGVAYLASLWFVEPTE